MKPAIAGAGSFTSARAGPADGPGTPRPRHVPAPEARAAGGLDPRSPAGPHAPRQGTRPGPGTQTPATVQMNFSGE